MKNQHYNHFQEYNKRGKVKKSRVSPLLQHIRSLEGAKLLKNGHNIFVRKSDKNLPATPDPSNYVSCFCVFFFYFFFWNSKYYQIKIQEL